MFGESYAKFYDGFNSDKNYEKEIKFVYEWAGRPGSIFDIGCGTASYWKFYPERTKLFGIEKSRSMHSSSDRIKNADIMTYTHKGNRFDCATALFDVLNYIPRHDWWKNLPIKKGGFFIFDIWDKEKVQQDGFRITERKSGDAKRLIAPLIFDGKKIDLMINVVLEKTSEIFYETHTMYLYSREEIEKFCGKEFEVCDYMRTKTWQTWVKCRRK